MAMAIEPADLPSPVESGQPSGLVNSAASSSLWCICGYADLRGVREIHEKAAHGPPRYICRG
jgi:hypothetical protein